MIKTHHHFDYEDAPGVWISSSIEDPLVYEYGEKFLKDQIDTPDFPPKLSIISGEPQYEADCLEAVRKSLQNGKTFFENAPEYIQKMMIEEREEIENGTVY